MSSTMNHTEEDRSDTPLPRHPAKRIVSIVLAVLPFIVVAGFVVAISLAEGWVGLGYFFLMIACIPILFLFSLTSVILAFKKTTEKRLEQTAKATSVISVLAFGIATLFMVMVYLGNTVG